MTYLANAKLLLGSGGRAVSGVFLLEHDEGEVAASLGQLVERPLDVLHLSELVEVRPQLLF